MSFLKKEKIALSILSLLILCSASSTHAASMRARLPNESATVGSIISVPLYVETDTPINALSATLLFPNFLDPLSVSYVGSPISLWIQQPSIDTTHNTVSAEGIILNEGFVGAGEILTVQVRVTGPGEGYVTLTDGALLARDGKGTNVLGTLEDSARFFASVGPGGFTALPVAAPSQDTGVVAPKITRYSSRIKSLEDFFLEGETLTNATVHIALRLSDMIERFEVASDSSGRFLFRYPLEDNRDESPSVLKVLRNQALAAVFTIEGLEYQFWVWAERDGVVTPETSPTAVAIEGFSWGALSLAVDPTTLLIIIAALLGLLITTFVGLLVLRALRQRGSLGE